MKENVVSGHPSVSGYEGEADAAYFSIDIDLPHLDLAYEIARKIVGFLTDRWCVQKEGLWVYFSDYKGFHIMLDIRIFGKVVPSKDLHLIFLKIRHNLIKQLKLDDISSYSRLCFSHINIDFIHLFLSGYKTYYLFPLI